MAAWCAQRIPHFSGWGCDPKTVGYEIEGELRGGVVYTHYTPTNVFASIALDAPLTKRFLYTMFWVPFVQYGVRHIGCMVEGSNLRSFNLCTRLGFQVEGRLRESAAEGEDVVLLGLLKRECKWL